MSDTSVLTDNRTDEELVIETAMDFMRQKKVFSAYDVTLEVRKVVGSDRTIQHRQARRTLPTMMNTGQMGEYDCELITLDVGGNGGENTWVYFPVGKTGYDHPLAQSHIAQLAVEDDEDDDNDDDDYENTTVDDSINSVSTVNNNVVVNVTAENRFHIPKSILKQITIPAGYDYYVISIDGVLQGRKPNTDGRVRIGDTKHLHGDKLCVEVDRNTIKVTTL